MKTTTRRRVLASVGVLITLQAMFTLVSLIQNIPISLRMGVSEWLQDLISVVFSATLAVMYWLALMGKVRKGFRKVVFLITWLDVLVIGLGMALIGILFSRAFPIPAFLLFAAAIFPFAVRGDSFSLRVHSHPKANEQSP